MHRVTVNACYDLLRKRGRQPMLRMVGDEEAPSPRWAAASRPRGRDRRDARRRRGARAVPDEFRVALVLADVEDLPYEQIAKILDVPVGTVKSRVHRGRIALAKAMGLHPREPDPRPGASERET